MNEFHCEPELPRDCGEMHQQERDSIDSSRMFPRFLDAQVHASRDCRIIKIHFQAFRCNRMNEQASFISRILASVLMENSQNFQLSMSMRIRMRLKLKFISSKIITSGHTSLKRSFRSTHPENVSENGIVSKMPKGFPQISVK
jgi:hypothetical protein